MGGGFMDDMPYYTYNPSFGGRRYPAGSPWGSRNVVRSPYFPEPEGSDIAEPYYNGGVNGYHRVPAVAERYGRGQKPPVETAKVPVRKIVVTDGKDVRKETPKEARKEAPKEARKEAPKETRKETSRVSEEAKKPPKKWFDNADDAARYVQSRYRGHVVRKTQPLKHLRIIKEVGEKLKNFQKQACDPEYLQKLRESNMERLKFNEMIMHQLLKLDSLQGVHPVVRDMRKAVTRELVRLQDVTEAAIASGRTPTAGDLKFVETPVNSADEDDAAQSCETEDEMAVQERNVEEVSVPLTTEDEEAAADAVGRMEIDDEKEGLTDPTIPECHAPADIVEEQPMAVEDCKEVATPAHERCDALANDETENRAGGSSHDENEEGRTSDRVQPASGHEFLGTDVDAEMELPGVHSSSAETVSTSAAWDEILVDAETTEACTLSTNPSSEDVEAEGRKTTRGECDRKRKLEDSDVGEGSTIDILRQLKRENEQLKQMFEQMMHQQATSICNLSERLERLEDHVRRGKKKPASGRKVNSIRKSRTQMDED